MSWQPIKDAPIDGTPLDLWVVSIIDHKIVGVRRLGCVWDADYKLWKDADGYLLSEAQAPTHFMLSPKPPTSPSFMPYEEE